jgi:hypothetical protein
MEPFFKALAVFQAARAQCNLPRDLAADIHGRLSFLDRLAFTAVFG